MGYPLTHRTIWREQNLNVPVSVYGVYDGPELLYIGMARDVSSRWSQHRKDKPWWSDDLVMVATSYPNRATAAAAELAAIRVLRPPHNTVGVG